MKIKETWVNMVGETKEVSDKRIISVVGKCRGWECFDCYYGRVNICRRYKGKKIYRKIMEERINKIKEIIYD